MKTSLLVTFFFLFAFHGRAQVEFAPVGATWHYGYSSYPFFSGFTEIVSVSDTSILGKVSKKIEVQTERKNLLNGDSITDNVVHFLCHQGDTVFHYDPQSMIDFTVLFDFSMDSGDTLFYVDDWYYFVLDSIGTAQLNGEPVNVQFGRTSTDQADHFVSTTITTKFGPLNRYLFIDLLDWCFLGVQHGPCYDFRCYEDGDFPLLQLSEEDCEYIYTSASEAAQEEQTLLFSPNPANDYLQILFPHPAQNAQLRLLSYSGALLLDRTLPNGTEQTELDLSTFPPGLLLLQYFENGQFAGTKKFIKI